jgi:hypothetical protein
MFQFGLANKLTAAEAVALKHRWRPVNSSMLYQKGARCVGRLGSLGACVR